MYLCYNLKSLEERQQRKIKKITRGKKGVLEESIAHASIVGDGIRIEEKFEFSWCQEKTKGL